MRLLLEDNSYDTTIAHARTLTGGDERTLTFHFYWNGSLSEKHYWSMRSCRLFHPTARIILWLEKNKSNEWNEKCANDIHCEFRDFNLQVEKQNPHLQGVKFKTRNSLSYYSDIVRYTILYNYGGIWADLDCFFLRSLAPLIALVGDEVAVYRWENKRYPNGAIFISQQKENPRLLAAIQFIDARNKGWGFQEAALTYDLPIDFLVLPCSWFDPDWIPNAQGTSIRRFFKRTTNTVTFDTFHPGAFCYHWHNKWNNGIESGSPFSQLTAQCLNTSAYKS